MFSIQLQQMFFSDFFFKKNAFVPHVSFIHVQLVLFDQGYAWVVLSSIPDTIPKCQTLVT